VRLEQIVSNLIINSIKYTPKGGLIEVELSRSEQHAIIRVRDDGAGIPAELIDHIFAPFYQERLGTSANKGLGLGLTIAQRLVALHGGDITAQSAGRDLGTEFVVKLPLSVASITDALRLETGTFSAESLTLTPRPARVRSRVLVIDDMEDGRQVLRDLLEALDVDVFDAGTGTRGVELVREVSPDLALVDIDLPDIDGFEVARRVRATRGNRGPVLVAVTGYGAAEDKNKAMSNGFDDYLVKPIDMARLSALLGSLAPHDDAADVGVHPTFASETPSETDENTEGVSTG
jgi:CheY-like chemotaxis protein